MRADELAPMPHWCAHPRFHERFNALCDAAGIDQASVVDSSPLIKQFARDAGKVARDTLLAESPELGGNLLMRLGSIARAVFTCDIQLAKTLRNTSAVALIYLDFDDRGFPKIASDFNTFENEFVRARNAHLNHRRAAIETEHAQKESRSRNNEGLFSFNRARKKDRLAHIDRISKLWIPKIYLYWSSVKTGCCR